MDLLLCVDAIPQRLVTGLAAISAAKLLQSKGRICSATTYHTRHWHQRLNVMADN